MYLLVVLNLIQVFYLHINFFFVSYLLYFFMPAIGPRFTVHEFGSLNAELPGLWLTNTFRDMVNAGGGVFPGTENPAEIINRDCMPSGHTMMTFITIILAFLKLVLITNIQILLLLN